jgi:hypothetical protein
VGDQRSHLIEDHNCAMLSGPLSLDKFTERIELEIGGDYAWYLAAQRRADGDDRRADTIREIRF